METLDRCLDMKGKRSELELKEKQSQMPDFWDDPKKAELFLKDVSGLKSWVNAYDSAKSAVDDMEVLLELDPESQETDEAFANAQRLVENLELRNMLGEEGDSLGAVLTINSGAGGTEANDWSAMLMRMYMRWGERNGYKMTVTELLEGDEVGIKSATIQFEGDYAYGYLKAESGVHRLVRISPFDASGRRQTSFAAVEIMPEITDNKEIELRDEDIKMDVFRSSGAGGQKVNKTSSAVRLTHLPTGIVVSSRVERSHFQNLENCKEMLRSKLAEIKEREHLEKISDIKGVQMKIDFGSAIRSYVFMPYQLVKDQRTEYENGNIQNVMDGDLDGFINAYLSLKAAD